MLAPVFVDTPPERDRPGCGWPTGVAYRGAGDRAEGGQVGMKFLVIWEMEISRRSAEMMKTVLGMPEYAKSVEDSGRCCWRRPLDNFWYFDVYPLVDMASLPVVPPEQ
jgi:hypothetical protein